MPRFTRPWLTFCCMRPLTCPAAASAIVSGRHFRLYPQRLAWQDAAQACTDRGGLLGTFRTQDEYAQFTAAVSRCVIGYRKWLGPIPAGVDCGAQGLSTRQHAAARWCLCPPPSVPHLQVAAAAQRYGPGLH